MSFHKIIRYFIVWRLALFLIAFAGSFLINAQKDYVYKGGIGFLGNILAPWASFDGIHYLNLATHWYGNFHTYQLYAFFPAYPWLIRTFNFFDNPLLISQLLSSVFLLVSVHFLYKLFLLDASPRVSKLAILLMAIFPTSFFLISSYTESLFLLLTVLTFYAAITRKFFLAAIFATLASLTRLSGIFLWPALIVEYLNYYKYDFQKISKNLSLASLLLPPLGLLSYMDYQFNKTGDYLFFIHSQPSFGANRVIDKLVLLHQVFYRYIRMLLTVQNRIDPVYFVVILEFICGLIFFLLIIAGLRNLRKSYLLYVGLSYILPTLTGTFSSVPRYVLVLFPCFLVASELLVNRSRSTKILFLSFSFVLLIISTVLFTRGYFVS